MNEKGEVIAFPNLESKFALRKPNGELIHMPKGRYVIVRHGDRPYTTVYLGKEAHVADDFTFDVQEEVTHSDEGAVQEAGIWEINSRKDYEELQERCKRLNRGESLEQQK